MKIAIPYEAGNVFEHFGHTEEFLICEVDDGKIINKNIVKTNCGGHDKLGGFLINNKIDALICGGIGGGAVNFMKQNNITLFAGNHGSINILLNNFINGKIMMNDKASCNHHDENGGHHDCSDHCH